MIEQRIAGSSTLALLQKVRELKASGADLVSFAAGEADFDTPEVVTKELLASVERGNTRYVATQGLPPLREVVAKDYNNRLGAEWVKPENVLVAAGAKQGIYLAMCGILTPGANDEVLIPKPYWVSYPGITKAAGGRAVYVETQKETAYFPTVAALEAAKSDKSKILIMSSPCNPTGTMISKEHLSEILKWCVANKIVLIYDEIYERLALKDTPHTSALSVCTQEESEFVIAVNAVSKSLAMTGWRMGYVLTHKDNIAALTALQSQMLTCLPGFIQDAATAGLNAVDELFPPILEKFKKRLVLLEKLLSEVKGISFAPPQGAFYAFLNVEALMKSKGIAEDKDLCSVLLDDAGIVVNPGSSFGMPGHVRMSFATSEEEITKGVERLKKYANS